MSSLHALPLQAKALLLDQTTPTRKHQVVKITIDNNRWRGRSFMALESSQGSLSIGGGIDLLQQRPRYVGTDEFFKERVRVFSKTPPLVTQIITNALPYAEVLEFCRPENPIYRVPFEGNNYIIKTLPIETKSAVIRESHLPTQLNHPNLVKVFGATEVNNRSVIVMEEAPGIDGIGYGNMHGIITPPMSMSIVGILESREADLRELDRTANRFAHALQIMKQLISAVEYLQSHNLVHRDLKLDNIVIDGGNWSEAPEGSITVKITDYGFLRRLPSLDNLLSELHMDSDVPAPMTASKRRYTACGTIGWAAPEIIKNILDANHEKTPSAKAIKLNELAYDCKLDNYGLGAIFHSLITGNTVQGTNHNSIPYAQLLQNAYDKEPKYSHLIPSQIQSLLKGMLERDPKSRLSIQQIKEHPLLNTEFSRFKSNYIKFVHKIAPQLHERHQKKSKGAAAED